MSSFSRLLRTAAALLALVTSPAALRAQAGVLDAPPVPYSRLLSINPLLLVFVGSISADYEQRLAPSVTLGGSVASFDLSSARYLVVDARARYYLTGRAFDGVAVGMSAGLADMRADDTTERSRALSVGFLVERQWLVGPEERLALTAGAGASRLFFGSDSDAFRTVLPGLRLSLGWGF